MIERAGFPYSDAAAGYFRTDVSRAKCARVEFNYGRVLGRIGNEGFVYVSSVVESDSLRF